MSSHSYVPLVTVIIPTFNRARTIRRALHSVLHQTYQNIEVIVIDDASTDDTELVVESFKDSRVRYMRQPTRCGAAVARNAGIQAAKGDYIALQDSDDEWLCEKLQKQMEIFSADESGLGVVYTAFVRVENFHCLYYPSNAIKEKSGSILGSLLNGNFIANPSVVIKRECFSKVGLYDEQLSRLQDWELFIRLAIHYDFYCVEEPLILAHHSRDSITANISALPIALKYILKKHENVFENHKGALAAQYYLLGRLICSSQNMLEARTYFMKSFQSVPFNIVYGGRVLITLFGYRFYRMASRILGRVNNLRLRNGV